MPSIRITRFAGLLPQMNPKALANDHAQVAHNCLLWDGWLRPMPQWTLDATLGSAPAGLYKDATQTKGYAPDYYLANPIRNFTEPFLTNKPVGINIRSLTRYLGTYNSGNSPTYLGVPTPSVSGHAFTITNNHQSVYPISRTYAITYVSGSMEGPPTVFEQIGTNGTLFEGDTVALSAALDVGQIIQYNITGIRLYRTIPGFDTSEQLGNPLETGFHFVASATFSPSTGPPGGIIMFNDTLDSSQIQGDLLISDQWVPPLSGSSTTAPIFFGQSEGGWSVNCRTNGLQDSAPSALQFSERFMPHAWPMQNTVGIPELATGMAIYYDDIFVGTQSIAYHTRIEAGEGEVLNINVRPFVNTYACVPNTMVSTNFGAMYASADGLIALMADRDTVTSRSVASPGDQMIVPFPLFNSFVTIRFSDAVHAAWWNGNYFGFTHNSSHQIYGYIFNQPSPSNQEFPLGQLVTIDTPLGAPVIDTVATGSGLFGVWNNLVYTFPLPGYGYDAAQKASYTWLSKRYVMPGTTNFAGMKIVNDNTGNLTVILRGYNANAGSAFTPNFLYTRTVAHSNPFRLPHQQHCIEWEIEVQGTAVIEEIHLATSFKDLIEEPNNG